MFNDETHDETHLTWAQRRELDLELWLMDNLGAISEIRPGQLDDADALRRLQTHATVLAGVIERLRLLRGDAGEVERVVAEARAELDRLP